MFGAWCFTTGGFKRYYDPRPPELIIDLSLITGDDYKKNYLDYAWNNATSAYSVELPPEMMDDVVDYEISFWFRHSANTPIENLGGWDLMFKQCMNFFRIRETEEGNIQHLGDRSALLQVCPTKEGKINIRASTYDLPS